MDNKSIVLIKDVKFLSKAIESVIRDLVRDELVVQPYDRLILTKLLTQDYMCLKTLMDEGLSVAKTSFKSSVLGLMIDSEVAIRIGSLGAKLMLGSSVESAKANALNGYIETEIAVKDFDQDNSIYSSPIFNRVRRRLRQLLVDFDPIKVVDNARVSKGTTSTPGAKSNTGKMAYFTRQSTHFGVPDDLYNYLQDRNLLHRLTQTFGQNALPTSGFGKEVSPDAVVKDYRPISEVISTVRKNVDKDRVISAYPHNVVYLTNGANDHLTEIIHQRDCRIEFTYQEKCSNALADYLANADEAWNRTATIDFSDCSGLISWQLLCRVIDNQDVLEFLNVVRGHNALYTFRLKKQSLTLNRRNPTIDVETLSQLLGDGASFFRYDVQDEIESDYDLEKMLMSQHPDFPLTRLKQHSIPYTISLIAEDNDSCVVDVSVYRYSHAGMGSGVTFPIMAALIGAITHECCSGKYRVFGDDVILMDVTPKEVSKLISVYQQFGLKVNVTKTCKADDVIRECVGTWFRLTRPNMFRMFTPYYLRQDISQLFSAEKCADYSVLHYAVEMANYFSLTRSQLAVLLTNKLMTNSAIPIMYVERGSGLFGIEVDSNVWDFYVPSFEKKIKKNSTSDMKNANEKSLGVRRLLMDEDFRPLIGSFAHKSTTLISTSPEYHLFRLPFKAILPKSFIDYGPHKWVDVEDVIDVNRDPVDSFTEFFSSFTSFIPVVTSYVIADDVGTLAWQARLVQQICKERSLGETDRPNRDKLSFIIANASLSIPYDVVQEWGNRFVNET